MTRTTGPVVLLAIAAIAFLAGCGPKVEAEYPVKGTVTLDDSPMADGEVVFRNDAKVTFSTFTVTNGQFEGKSEAGTFKVEVSSYKDEAVTADATGYAPPGGTTKKNVVLPDYNANSKLTAEVKTSGANEYKFDAKTK